MQIEKLRSEVDSFGLDNILVIETLTPQDIASGISSDRFRSLERHGQLFTARKMLASAISSHGKNAGVIGYTDSDMRGLIPYLKYGHSIFVLTNSSPQGVVLDYKIEGKSYTAVCLKPDEKLSQFIQGDTLFLPMHQLHEIQKRGYSLVYYLQRAKDAPEVTDLTQAILNVSLADQNGKIDIKNADMIKKKLEKLESQQRSMRIWLGLILGGALALIYGVLSVLEFRQSMYISALLQSFGVSRFLLGLRSVFENLIIVNAVTLGVIYLLARNHDTVFAALRVKSFSDVNALYWGQETMWIIIAANVGVVISSLPVFWALRKQVGNILE